jgi:hypothetical protein
VGEGSDQIVQVGSDHGGFGVDDEIASDASQDRESRTSRDFAETSFAAISDYSGPDLLRNRDTESQLLTGCFEDEERKERRMQSHAPVVDEPKFAARAKRLERLSRCHRTIASIVTRRQAFAALRAPSFQHEAACLRAHPLAKAMRLRTTAIVGLECTLHWNNSLFTKTPISENGKPINHSRLLSRRKGPPIAP